MAEVTLHNLSINKKAKKVVFRRGRGSASGGGSYSGRGVKGQKARSGGSHGLKLRGLKQMLRAKPKMGGFKSLARKKVTIDLDTLNRFFEAGSLVTPKKLLDRKIISTTSDGLKVLGSGVLTRKMTVVAHQFSETAKQAILNAGGEARLIVRPKKTTNKSAKKKAKK